MPKILPEMSALDPTLILNKLPVAVVDEPGFQYMEKSDPEERAVEVEDR